MRVSIIDTGICNLGSISRAVRHVGVEPHIIRTAHDVLAAPAIVLPGVGAFGDGMRALNAAGLSSAVRRVAKEGRLVLGVCLGMQLFADGSDESPEEGGLGLITGRVEALDNTRGRVPNIGWAPLQLKRRSALFPNPSDRSYYTVHGYHFVPRDPEVVAATMDFGGQAIAMAVEQRNLFGCQFHPELSQSAGLDLLMAFFDYVRARVPVAH